MLYTQRLIDANIEASVGSVGDSYDNALAETITRLFKTECINRKKPWKTTSQLEWETLIALRLNKPSSAMVFG